MNNRFVRLVATTTLLAAVAASSFSQTQPIRVSFLWHMHQPIYYPYESPVQVDAAGRFSFSVVDVHNQRLGPYTGWPRDAVQAGLALPHLGAQISFSGSLIQNLDALAAAGVNGGQWSNWDSAYGQAIGWSTALGNPRLDLLAFGFHHPLMPLLDEQDIRMQIRLHKLIYQNTWSGGTPYSRGMFPAETAFSTRMIPALAAEGVEWVMVDNIHFDRACVGYPHTPASNLFAPNPADQLNPDPAAGGGGWVQLQNLWAPSRVSAPFGYQPHRAQHIDPDTGTATQIVVVPAARYEGNEDGRGGYGAFLYDQVMDQYLAYNTDAAHPMLVLLHHDGDNFGGGSESYYHSNFQNMVSWISSDPDYEATTVQDYLDRFPPDASDVIHVESGSWAGADNGDPEFKKWLGDPDAGGWSPDRNSWAVLTAAKHRVFMADALQPVANLNNVLNGTGSDTAKAWRWLLVSEASDYWYWDGTEIWDSDVTRGCNQAVAFADPVIAGQVDNFAPTIFVPQREPYNPGGYEWAATPEPSDFEVWTHAYDVSGLSSVTLRWRVDADGVNPPASVQNETYAGGVEVGVWNDVAMTASDAPTPSGILAPTYRAPRYGAMITGPQDVLIDYYVEAVDGQGNLARSEVQHVYVGVGGTGGGSNVSIDPDPAVAGQPVTISYDPAGGPLAGAGQVYLHYGFDDWSSVVSPDPAMTWNAVESRWEISVGVNSSASQLDVVFNNGAGVWDSNNGADWHYVVTGGDPGGGFMMDGLLDAGAVEVAVNGGRHLWAALSGDVLYVATEDAGEGDDVFIYLAQTPGALQVANWAKAGQIAGWDAYLADENDNDYESWFDAAGAREAASGANGGVLEGTLNLADEFGARPSEIYLAVGLFNTPDGGALRPSLQAPASVNGDGNIDAAEYVLVDLGTLGGGCAEDVNGDDVVDLTDLAVLLSNFDATGAAREDGDIDGDGDVDLTDFALLLAGFDAVCS